MRSRRWALHPTRFLVVPKLVAISFTQPLLTVLADLFGIVGGFLVAVTYLEVGPATFVERLQTALFVKDLVTGLIKSIIFAQLIVIVGAIAGFRTRGGADAVGRSTTTAVVAGIFAVIVADAVGQPGVLLRRVSAVDCFPVEVEALVARYGPRTILQGVESGGSSRARCG